MKQQEQLNRQGKRYIDSIRYAVARCWQSCCEYDGIPVDSRFVVFSEDNPYVKFYNIGLAQLWQAEEDYRNGGYVGLTYKSHKP